MESSSFSLYMSPNHEPTPSISQDCPLTNFFYINFDYTHMTFSSQTNATNPVPDFTTALNEILLIPCEVLCNCNELTVLDRDHHNTIILYDIFFAVPIPPEILDAILPHMGACARQMIAHHSSERRNMWEMNVTLHVTTRMVEDVNDNGQDHRASLASQLVDLLEKDNSSHHSLYTTEQCAICLEEFYKGSKSEVVYTKCLHAFHKDCAVKWLQQCINRQSSYSCPLCRCQMI